MMNDDTSPDIQSTQKPSVRLTRSATGRISSTVYMPAGAAKDELFQAADDALDCLCYVAEKAKNVRREQSEVEEAA